MSFVICEGSQESRFIRECLPESLENGDQLLLLDSGLKVRLQNSITMKRIGRKHKPVLISCAEGKPKRPTPASREWGSDAVWNREKPATSPWRTDRYRTASDSDRMLDSIENTYS